MITKTEQKKAFFNVLTPYFTKLGFKKHLSGGAPTYYLNNNGIVTHFFFNFFSNKEIGSGSLNLTNYEVEDYILNIGIPTMILDKYREKGRLHLPTVSLRKLPDNIKARPLKTISEVEDFAKAYIQFYENQGTKFIEKYSYLPNILTEIDKMEAEGKNFKDLVSGMGDAFIRLLIISKLCNSPLFNKRLEKIDGMIQSATEWLPYWEKYKKVLETIEPKYNIV